MTIYNRAEINDGLKILGDTRGYMLVAELLRGRMLDDGSADPVYFAEIAGLLKDKYNIDVQSRSGPTQNEPRQNSGTVFDEIERDATGESRLEPEQNLQAIQRQGLES